jgi:PAS domain S-box-containing protein
MPAKHETLQSLRNELESVRSRLEEAEAVIAAIRSDEVDALVVNTRTGEQVFTLRTAELPYRLFIERMREGAITVSDDGTIAYANDCFARMMRLPLSQVMGAPVNRFIRPEDQSAFQALVQIDRNGQGRSEFLLQAADGAAVPVYIASSRFSVDEVQGTCIVVTDLTELRAAQEALRRSERLASVGTLATGIAHEVNNPLNSILLTARYALELKDEPDGGPPVMEESLRTVISEAQRCGRIVKALLQFARHEKTGKWPADLNDAIRRGVDLARTYLPDCKAQFDCTLQDGLPPVEYNPTEMDQVLVNLLQNSVQAGQGHVHVSIRTGRHGDWVSLTVEDNGPGIPPEHLGRIFDPFYSTRFESGGTGLGLSVVHGIITDHGGTISVESRVGQGTAFQIHLPVSVKGESTHGQVAAG